MKTVNISRTILKSAPLFEGGEAFIYEYNGNILKVYKDIIDKPQKEAKLKVLIDAPLPPQVVQPLALAYDTNQKFIGYVMQRVFGEELKRLSNRKFIKVNNITVKEITYMLMQIKNTVEQLHKNNIYISDFNDCNILFDKDYNVYFVDADSWTVNDMRCQVCMDSFRDPLLKGDNFSASTDAYAFAIIVFKALTRLHPFGGTMDPDIPLLERMGKRLSVIDRNDIKVPDMASKWDFISPDLLVDLKTVLETDKRYVVDKSLFEFSNGLQYCDKHKDFYYKQFTSCPICHTSATIKTAPVASTVTTVGIPYSLIFQQDNIKAILSLYSYITADNRVVNRKTGKDYAFNPALRYYFSYDGRNVFVANNNGFVVNDKTYVETAYRSNIVVHGDSVYYIAKNNMLTRLTVLEHGNEILPIADVAFNCVFDVTESGQYFICNIYDNMKVLNINGKNYVLKTTDKVEDYGIHHDNISGEWLFVYENSNGEFRTMAFYENRLMFEETTFKYSTELGNLCFSNRTIFSPHDAAIRGFNYSKNIYKDFECPIVAENTKLVKQGPKFIATNDTEIYQVG